MDETTDKTTTIYRYDGWKMLQFCGFGLGCGVILLLFAIPSLVTLVQNPRIVLIAPVASVFMALVGVFCLLCAVPAVQYLWKRLGARIEIRDGRIYGINRGGKVRVQGDLAGCRELNAFNQMGPTGVSFDYQVVFVTGQSLRFEEHVANLDGLKKAIEDASGLTFTPKPRK